MFDEVGNLNVVMVFYQGVILKVNSGGQWPLFMLNSKLMKNFWLLCQGVIFNHFDDEDSDVLVKKYIFQHWTEHHREEATLVNEIVCNLV